LSAVAINADGYFHSVTQTAAIESLAKIGGAAVAPALIQAIRAFYADPSRAAIRAVAQVVPAEQGRPALTAVVTNADGYFLPSVRLAAEEALAVKKA
jgi:hypothetical protein